MRPTARGIGLLIAGGTLGVVAAAVGGLDLARFAALLLGLLGVALGAVLVTRVRAAGVRARRVVDPDRPVVGQWAAVHLQIEGGRLGAWTRLRERTPAQVQRSPVTPTPAGWTYRIRPGQRGYVGLGPSTVVHGDPLGLVRWRVPGDRGEPVLVWPRTLPLAGLHRLRDLGGGDAAAFGSPERSVEDLTVREYVEGDDLHRVHWRSSARRGQLMVRSDEPSRPHAFDLVLDIKRGAGAEWAVSAFASLAVRLLTEGIPVRLHTCRRAGPEAEPEMSTHTCTDPATALDVVATATATPAGWQNEVATAVPPAAPCVIAVFQQPRPALLARLARVPQPRRSFALVVSERLEAVASLSGMAAQGWAVHTARPHADLAGIERAWDELLAPVRLR